MRITRAALMAALLIASTVGLLGSPALGGATPAWSIQTTPNHGYLINELDAVSCTSTTACTAIGSYRAMDGFYRTLIESWDGTSWSIVASPNPAVGGNTLTGVSCSSSTACIAVGWYPDAGVYQTLIERWDGSSWTIVPSPNSSATQNNQLNAVSCTSATACTAVGWHQDASAGEQTLIETWDGTSWSIVPSPNTSATKNNSLTGVSCTSATACTAVGYHANESGYLNETLIERWDGTSWSIVPSPSHAIGDDTLTGVSCTSSTACTAVGRYLNAGYYQTLIERWDGTSWTVVPSPNTSSTAKNELNAVSCTSATACTAVGDYQDASGVHRTLIEGWDGTSWTIVPSPNTATTEDNILRGVSCIASTACTVVGRYTNEAGYWQTLIERWDGTSWSIVPSADHSGENALNAVSCLSATACTAVGYYLGSGGFYQTLIESWDGTKWSIVPSPNRYGKWNFLNGVSCTSATACIAVGESTEVAVSAGLTLIERWDGSSWSIMPSPSTSSVSDFLRGVSCTSATACTAVGGYWNENVSPHVLQTLIESWDGTSWSIVPSPNISPDEPNVLNDVSCTSPTACTAVGRGNWQTLIETWNGTSWSVVPSPGHSTDPSKESGLNGVSCISATACTAVGWHESASDVGQTLIETWDGTSWSIVPSPNTSTNKHNFLNGVSCTSGTACTAVGRYDNDSGASQTLIETWDGTSWSIVPSPNTSDGSALRGVSCTSATACTAVGSDGDTLAVSNVPAATGTPTATSTPTDTPVPPTSTPTPTDTPVPTATSTHTATSTPTDTPMPPTSTPTATDTPVPTATNTPTATSTPTDTPVPATSTPTATNTPTATSTPTGCLTLRQKFQLIIGIVQHFGANAGDPGYDPTFDVNHDGKINAEDVSVVLRTPGCR